MKTYGMWTAVLLVILVAVNCDQASEAQTLGTSHRSRQATQRLRPVLQRTMAGKGFAWGCPIHIRIFKAEKLLELWIRHKGRFRLFKSYPICTYGSMGLGPKTRVGDSRAPEGFYFVAPRQMNPYSRYHLAFNLGYPNDYDRLHGRSGSALMVHGGCVSIGCFAMTDAAMEEIYTLAEAALRNGQPFFRVHIFPFRMTAQNMRQYRNSRWYRFWRNLKTGHDWFVANGGLPPEVTVRSGRYHYRAISP